MSILSGGSAVFIDQIPGKQRLIALSRSASAFRCIAPPTARRCWPAFSGEDAAALIDKSVAEHPDHPLADRAKLLREIETVRRKHLAFDLGEHGVGISAVGIAVLEFLRPAGRCLYSRPNPALRPAARGARSGTARLSRQAACGRRQVGAPLLGQTHPHKLYISGARPPERRSCPASEPHFQSREASALGST